MKDKVFYAICGAIALGMIGLALVWPQGLGLRSPPPFGHGLIMPDVVRANQEKAAREAKKQADASTHAAQKAQDSASRQSARQQTASGKVPDARP